jgi:hypothetical protein
MAETGATARVDAKVSPAGAVSHQHNEIGFISVACPCAADKAVGVPGNNAN